MVSLQQIAEGVLLGTPRYAAKHSLRVTVPNSLLEQALAFRKPVVFYGSKHNPGAAACGAEMAHAFSRDAVGIECVERPTDEMVVELAKKQRARRSVLDRVRSSAAPRRTSMILNSIRRKSQAARKSQATSHAS